ncbi:hypothetical protein HDV00_010726 [Rhizophlyctis rosea]|nr:hypothetical protein HDV00_010726 [Rhizophlyctis rosea]
MNDFPFHPFSQLVKRVREQLQMDPAQKRSNSKGRTIEDICDASTDEEETHSVDEQTVPEPPSAKKPSDTFTPCANSHCTHRLNLHRCPTCRRCRTARYCSLPCQRLHWDRSHKNTCSPHPEGLLPEWTQSQTLKHIPWAEVTTAEGDETWRVGSDKKTMWTLAAMTSEIQVGVIDENDAQPSSGWGFSFGVGDTAKKDDTVHSQERSYRRMVQLFRRSAHRRRLKHPALISQIKSYMLKRDYQSALRSTTESTAHMYNPMSGASLVLVSDYEHLFEVLQLQIQCKIALAKNNPAGPYIKQALQECTFILYTGAIPSHVLTPATTQPFKTLEQEAKTCDQMWGFLEGSTIPQIYSRPRRSPPMNIRKLKKLAKKQSKSHPPSIHFADTLLTRKYVLNARTNDDTCPICQTPWTDLPTQTAAIVASCQHATCAPCLSRFHSECQKAFTTDAIEGEVKTHFRCAVCREPLPDDILKSMAREAVRDKMIVALEDLVPLLEMGGGNAEALVTTLLLKRSFDVAKIVDLVFNMVGLMTASLPSGWDTEQKQSVYRVARRPVVAVQEEYDAVRWRLAGMFDSREGEYRRLLERLRVLERDLASVRADAARDIYMQMNAVEGMGERFAGAGGKAGGERVYVDLHGLHIAEAVAVLEEFLVPVLPVLKGRVFVVVGRGRHSKGGVGVLKDGVRRFLEGVQGVRVREGVGNEGVLVLEAL